MPEHTLPFILYHSLNLKGFWHTDIKLCPEFTALYASKKNSVTYIEQYICRVFCSEDSLSLITLGGKNLANI